ncbi:MAG: M1 family peptidase, partial [Saprospiraceae bacterium]
MKIYAIPFFLLLFSVGGSTITNAQAPVFTHDDTLRGSITPQRAWWDLTFYNLKLKVDPTAKSIAGSNEIHYIVLTSSQVLQIDLQPPLQIERVEQDGQRLTAERQGKNAYFVQLRKPQVVGAREYVTVWYSGKPRVAKRAPWDGGFSWSKDDAGQPFVATSCQGLGASVWWPCKDHMYDEPDSQAISITV